MCICILWYWTSSTIQICVSTNPLGYLTECQDPDVRLLFSSNSTFQLPRVRSVVPRLHVMDCLRISSTPRAEAEE